MPKRVATVIFYVGLVGWAIVLVWFGVVLFTAELEDGPIVNALWEWRALVVGLLLVAVMLGGVGRSEL